MGICISTFVFLNKNIRVKVIRNIVHCKNNVVHYNYTFEYNGIEYLYKIRIKDMKRTCTLNPPSDDLNQIQDACYLNCRDYHGFII